MFRSRKPALAALAIAAASAVALGVAPTTATAAPAAPAGQVTESSSSQTNNSGIGLRFKNDTGKDIWIGQSKDRDGLDAWGRVHENGRSDWFSSYKDSYGNTDLCLHLYTVEHDGLGRAVPGKQIGRVHTQDRTDATPFGWLTEALGEKMTLSLGVGKEETIKIGDTQAWFKRLDNSSDRVQFEVHLKSTSSTEFEPVTPTLPAQAKVEVSNQTDRSFEAFDHDVPRGATKAVAQFDPRGANTNRGKFGVYNAPASYHDFWIGSEQGSGRYGAPLTVSNTKLKNIEMNAKDARNFGVLGSFDDETAGHHYTVSRENTGDGGTATFRITVRNI